MIPLSKAKINGKTIYIGADMSAVSKALGDVETKAKESQNQLSTLNKALKLNPNDVELLSEKQKVLSDSIKSTTEKLNLLQQAQEKVKAEYESGEIDGNTYYKFKASVAEAQNQLGKLKDEAEKTQKAIDKQGSEVEETAEQTDDLGKESKEASSKMNKMKTTAKELATKIDLVGNSSKLAKSSISAMAGVMKTAVGAFTGFLTGAVSVAKASINIGQSFESANSQLAATMGKSTDEITELTAKAKELGSTTSFSATEAAEGLNILAQSGLTAEEQTAAIGSVLNLAAAGSLDMASAASYTTGAIKGFGDVMDNANYYTDLMAKGATLANTNVNDLGAALSASSATASGYGQKADGVTLSLLKLAEQGVTGEAAATSLNRAMADLYTPTDGAKTALQELGISAYDANGNTRDFNTVVAELNTKLSTMNDETANAYKNTIFTTNGLNAYNKMCATSAEKSQAFADGLANASGSAKEQAETMLDNLPGKITLMQSAAEGFGLAVYEGMQEPLKGIVEQATSYLGDLQKAFEDSGINGVIEELGTIFADVINQISEFLPQATQMAVGFFNNFVDGIVSALPSLIPSLIESGENLIYGLLNGIVDTFLSLKDILPDILPQLSESLFNVATEILDSFGRIAMDIAKMIPTIVPYFVDGFMILIREIISNADRIINALMKSLPEILEQLIDAINKFLPDITEDLLNFISNILQGLLGMLPTLLNTLIEFAMSLIEGIVNWLSVPENIATLVNAFVDCITAVVQELPTIIERIVSVLPQLIESLINGILQSIPQIIEAGINLLTSLVQALPQIIQTIVSVLPQIIDAIINAILDNLPLLIDAGIQLFIALIEDLPTIIVEVVKAIPKIITSILNALAKNFPKIATQGIKLFTQLIAKVPEILKKIGEGLVKIWDGITNAISGWFNGMKDVGKNLIKGIWEGISNMGEWIWNKISEWAGGIVDGIKDFFGIHSPSRLFRDEIGKNLALGIGEGFADTMGTVSNDMAKTLPSDFDISPVLHSTAEILSNSPKIESVAPFVGSNISNNSNSVSNFNVYVNIDSISSEFGGDISKLVNTVKNEISLSIDRRMRVCR